MAENDEHLVEITSTELVKALEKQNFCEAERLIKQSSDPEYLNRGPYGTVPLNIVLSGDSGYQNLYLAKLLVIKGANVNPFSHQTLVTPLELAVTLYLDVYAPCHRVGYFRGDKPIKHIGLDHKKVTSALEWKKQLMEMIDLLIAYGSDPVVVMDPVVPCVFHTVVSHQNPDIELITKLFEAGGDFNKQDIHGNTPLMDLFSAVDRDAAWPVFSQILTLTNELDLNLQNCRKETLLWCAMQAGSPRIAIELIRLGADTTVEVPIEQNSLSALFAPLIQNSSPYLSFWKESYNTKFVLQIFNKVVSECIYPVVDCTNIHSSTVPVLSCLLEVVTKFPVSSLVNQEISEEDVALLMFGNLKAGLQQLCVRKLMGCLVSSQQSIIDLAELMEDTSEVFGLTPEVNDGYVISRLNPTVVNVLIRERLQLPPAVTGRFLVEAARLQIGAYLLTVESPDCYAGCDGSRSSPSLFGNPLSDVEDYEDFGEDTDEDSDYGFDFG